MDEHAELLAVPTYLEDVEVGDEVTLPGDVEHSTVKGTGAEGVRGESGVMRTLVRLDCEHNIGGDRVEHTGERLDTVPRWVPLADLRNVTIWGEALGREDPTVLITALVDEVLALRGDVRDLHESRRMRTLAEQITGNRGGA